MGKLTIIIFYLLIIFLISCSDPNGIAIIQEAKFRYELGDLDGTLDLLDRAESAHYDCGNSYLMASTMINDLRAKTYLKKGEYKRARMVLDSSYSYGGNLDSLRIKSYQLELGADLLSQMIDFDLPKVTFKLEPASKAIYALIPLSNGMDTIRLEAVHDINSMDVVNTNSIDTKEWIAEFRLTEKYLMIKGAMNKKEDN